MLNKSIWRLAFLRDSTCPICRQKIENRRKVTVKKASPEHKDIRSFECEVLYCETCGLPYADKILENEFYNATGCWFDVFYPKNKTSKEAIQYQMFYRRKKLPVEKKKDETYAYELVPYNTSVWRVAQTLCTLPCDTNYCPWCKTKLVHDYTFVPVSDYQQAKVWGKKCYSCKILFVPESNRIDEIIRDNPSAKGFTLDGKALWNASNVERKKQCDKERRIKKAEIKVKKQNLQMERKQKLASILSSVVMICVEVQGKINEYIIVENKSDSTDDTVLHYKSVDGRELLSAAFASERKKEGCLKGSRFSVVRCVFKDSRTNRLPHYMLPEQLTIKKDGGYYSSLINRNYELVDLLLYSPISKRYELMAATYDKANKCCFTDIGVFRRFVQEHGNPRKKIAFEDVFFSNALSNYDLKTQSILMCYGYNVSAANNLSTSERREILAEIIDLEILEVYKIVSLLEFHCNIHSGEKDYYARLKWMDDKRFVEKYKVNPSRFLIAKSTKNLNL